MSHFSHREYFRRYKLNVEQYGEILVAQALGGEKMGDAQPGYDILVDRAQVIKILQRAGTAKKQVKSFFEIPTKNVRIEVKSKLSTTKTGQADVVHCGKTKFDGARGKEGMTHLAIVIVHPGSRTEGQDPTLEGEVDRAWLLTRRVAKSLRTKGKSRYIPLGKVEKSTTEKINIKEILTDVAEGMILLKKRARG